MDKAEAFQAWVYEVELPSIRKVGSYSVQAPGPADKKGKNWHSKRLGGKELMKLKNATLQQVALGRQDPSCMQQQPITSTRRCWAA